MPDATKIMLSPQELRIVSDTSWLLTKQEIIRKVYEIFNAQVAVISELFLEHKAEMPGAIFAARPKISRGENYRSLPYVILDYPSVFGRQDMFAFRTMFWWGNFFSVTLHLAGHYKLLFEEKIAECLTEGEGEVFYLCINDDAWEHHFEPGNYRVVDSLDAQQLKLLIAEKEFVKIAVKIELESWNELESLLPMAMTKLIGLLI